MPIATRQSRPAERGRRAVASESPWRGRAAGASESPLTRPEPTTRTGRADPGLQRWNSREWQAIRYAVYRTLIDMTVFPALDRDGVPFPNALHDSAVRHGLLDAMTGQPTERLFWLNPGLRPPGVPM